MLDANLKAQLKAYLERVKLPFEITASLDDSAAAEEMHGLLQDIVSLSDKITLKTDGTDPRKPSFALKLTKEAVNRSVDVMGQPAAIEQAFALHQLCHAHNLQEFGMVVDPSGLHPSVRKPAQAKS